MFLLDCVTIHRIFIKSLLDHFNLYVCFLTKHFYEGKLLCLMLMLNNYMYDQLGILFILIQERNQSRNPSRTTSRGSSRNETPKILREEMDRLYGGDSRIGITLFYFCYRFTHILFRLNLFLTPDLIASSLHFFTC